MVTKPRRPKLAPDQRKLLAEFVQANLNLHARDAAKAFLDRYGLSVSADTVYDIRSALNCGGIRYAKAEPGICIHCTAVPGQFPAMPWGYKGGDLCKGCLEAIAEEREEERWRETMGRFYAERERRTA